MGLDLSFRFDGWIQSLPASPRDAGLVKGLVVRPAMGQRERPASIEVLPEGGISGDAWEPLDDPRYAPNENQISLINIHLLAALVEGDAGKMALSGDNLQVDLDLSEENLPVGTRLTIGSVELQVSPIPHRPCARFAQRFGKTAAKKVARANRLGLRGRGVMCAILAGGRISVGDEIRVQRG